MDPPTYPFEETSFMNGPLPTSEGIPLLLQMENLHIIDISITAQLTHLVLST